MNTVSDMAGHPTPWSTRVGRTPLSRQDAIWALAAALVSAFLAFCILTLWRADLRVPFDYAGDATSTSMLIRGLTRHGWYLTNPELNAPFGQQYYDAPLGAENFHFLVIKTLAIVLGNSQATFNSYFFLTFPAAALTAFLFFRAVGMGRPCSLVFSGLFALAPYHFARGQSHLFLSGYFAVPLFCWVAFRILTDRPLVSLRRGNRRLLVATGVCCVLAASTDTYYAVFALLLILGAAGVAFIVRPSVRPIRRGAGAAAAIVMLVLVNQAPSILYWQKHGPNVEAIGRTAIDTERYALRFSELVLPSPRHRLAAFRDATMHYEKGKLYPGECCSALGIAASTGFLLAILRALVALAGSSRQGRSAGSDARDPLAVLILVGFLVASLGGVSSLVSAFVSAQIRTWSRMSIVIGLLGLGVLGLTAERAWLFVQTRIGGRARQAAGICLGVAVLLLGSLDQSPPRIFGAYEATKAKFENDRDFVRRLESTLPNGSMVFQYPIRPYPEWPAQENLVDYDLLNMYQHSERVRWSYGGLKGRPGTDWQRSLAQLPLEAQLTGLALIGFKGVTVDGAGYPGRGREVRDQLQGITGSAPIEDGYGRLAYFSLKLVADRVSKAGSAELRESLRDAVLQPVMPERGSGLTRGNRSVDWRESSLIGGSGVINLRNLTSRPQRIVLSAILLGGVDQLTVTYPDGASERVAVNSSGTRLERSLLLMPGPHSLEFRRTNAASRSEVVITALETKVVGIEEFTNEVLNRR
jgi:hypothetical protein